MFLKSPNTYPFIRHRVVNYMDQITKRVSSLIYIFNILNTLVNQHIIELTQITKSQNIKYHIDHYTK